MDNLTACAIAARRAGMSYGQYMAQKPRQIKPIMPPELKAEPQEHRRTCQSCGKQFDTSGRAANSLYCDAWCYREALNKRARERSRKKSGISEDDILVCPNCGISFRRGSRHGGAKYCSDECAAERRKEIKREKYGHQRTDL